MNFRKTRKPFCFSGLGVRITVFYRKCVAETGYHRRNRELDEIAAQLAKA